MRFVSDLTMTILILNGSGQKCKKMTKNVSKVINKEVKAANQRGERHKNVVQLCKEEGPTAA